MYRAAQRRRQHDDEWRYLPERERGECRRGEREVPTRVDGAGPDRVVERGKQDADDDGVYAVERRGDGTVALQPFPERQHADDEQEGRQKNRDHYIRGRRRISARSSPALD